MTKGSTPPPAYRIRTARLLLRCWDPADAPRLHTAVLESREHLLPWMPWAQDPEPLEERIQRLRLFRSQFDRDEAYVYGVFDPEETRVLGGSGLHRRGAAGGLEIGYWIHKDFINQGLATEISAALVKVAFEVHHVERVEIHCDPRNTRSAAIPRKLGFSHEATLRRRLPSSGGERGDEMIWTIFADAYPGSPAFNAEIQAFDAAGRRLI